MKNIHMNKVNNAGTEHEYKNNVKIKIHLVFNLCNRVQVITELSKLTSEHVGCTEFYGNRKQLNKKHLRCNP
jgi:hypothetical protein